ncbi:SRPBCC family protein [Nostocoides sp. HKS02]|uniref:SRPBCC family protein n=1 Tax=Nostocoides sp. HKS02 TaxID=1813880 RepID=UPI0012B4F49C|nr:SRPBCC family protein [Tetrasphaera sp. HKS02]QGN58040.1 hypothetical protein GKE56_09240 [Tetrasphaera sp. HKS02]
MTTVVSRWGEHGARPTPLPANTALFAELEAAESILVTCDPLAAWTLAADIPRVGEFSPECVSARWIGSTPGPRAGARFEGTNRKVDDSDEYIWTRPGTVVLADVGRSFGFVVGDRYRGAPASHWVYTFTHTESNICRIDLTFHHVPDGLTGLRLAADEDPAHAVEIVAARMAELRAGMQTTLAAMKTTLEDR